MEYETDDPRLIKRYANRKLYDTRDSRYVTLQQIAVFIREGEDVRIIDNTTKEDLTNVTLAQIIYENEKTSGETGGSGAGRGRLKDLIQRSGEKIMTSLRSGPVVKFVDKESKALTRAVMDQSREALEEVQRAADDRVKGLVGTAIGHVHQLHGEIGRLQARVEELESRLVALQRKRTGDTEPPGNIEE